MLGGGVTGRRHDVTAGIKTSEHLPQRRGQNPDAIVLQVRIVRGVVTAHGAHAVFRGPPQRRVPEHVRRRHVHDVRRERLHLVPLPRLQRRRHLVLPAAGHGYVRDVRDVVPVVIRGFREIALRQVWGHDEDRGIASSAEVMREALHGARDAVDVGPDGREDDDAALAGVAAGRAAVADGFVVNDGHRRRDDVLPERVRKSPGRILPVPFARSTPTGAAARTDPPPAVVLPVAHDVRAHRLRYHPASLGQRSQ